jgi:hypothetical protein
MLKKLSFDGCANDIQCKVRALRWIVENAYLKHPSVQTPSVSVIESEDSTEEKECAGKNNLVSVTESVMSNWYVPYCEPGSRPFGRDRLSDLFDFLRIVIWSRMIDESAVNRIIIEPYLDAPELTEVAKYQDLKKIQTRLILTDIESLPAQPPPSGRPFSRRSLKQFSSSEDASLDHFTDAMTHEAIYLAKAERKAYSDMVEESYAGEVNEGKKQFIEEFEKRLIWLPLAWKSQESLQHAKNIAEHYDNLKKVTFRYYTNKFKYFCLSKDMQDIYEQAFSKGQHLVVNFVSEKLGSEKYDRSPFTTDMKSLRERSLPNTKSH